MPISVVVDKAMPFAGESIKKTALCLNEVMTTEYVMGGIGCG
jgi:hypothetical protein